MSDRDHNHSRSETAEAAAGTADRSPGRSKETTPSPPEIVEPDGMEGQLISERYRLEQCLGEGAMGRVYRATHVWMEKTVAVKVLHRELTEHRELVARFRREARAAAALDHPNICGATDFGCRENGAFFLVLEYLDGKTLLELLEAEEYLAPRRALDLTRQLASALAHAHDQGVVHRDLKPENIMVLEAEQGEESVKIMDFGIARLLSNSSPKNEDQKKEDGRRRLTRKGSVFGTPHYMSPEQIAGEEVDGRTDIYALGIILFEMLTGSLPYDGETITRVMGRHVSAPVPALSEMSVDSHELRAPLQRIVETLLAKDAQNRPRDGREVIELVDGTEAELRVNESDGNSPIVALLIAATVGLMYTLLLGTVATIGYVAIASGDWEVFSDSVEQADAVEENLRSERERLLEDDQIQKAVTAAETGDRKRLETLLEEGEENPHLRYLALEADLRAGHREDVVERAETILEYEEAYAWDEQLVEYVVEEIVGESEARTLLAEYMNATIRDVLADRAATGGDWGMRNAAYQLLEQENQLDELEDWQRITASLWQVNQCSRRAEKLDRLRQIGNPGAIPTLEAFQSLPTDGCGRFSREDCIGCIRGDLEDVIRELRDQ